MALDAIRGSDLALEVAALDALADAPGERGRRLEALGERTTRCLPARSPRTARGRRSSPAAPTPRRAPGSRSRRWRTATLLDAAGRRFGYHSPFARWWRPTATRTRAARSPRCASRPPRAARSRCSLPPRTRRRARAADGRPQGAADEARSALELAGGDLDALRGGARAVLVAALAERGALDEARALVDGSPGLRRARVRLWLATGTTSAPTPRRTRASDHATAAVALAHLGRREEAAALADEALARAERFGAPVPLVIALYARALAEPDADARIALCRRALARGRRRAGRWTASASGSSSAARCPLGARVHAREELRPALAEADALGAMPLAARARRELVATGLRPRQAAIEGEGGADPAPARDLLAGRRRQGQSRDRPRAVPEHQDRRDASGGRIPQARHQLARRAARRAAAGLTAQHRGVRCPVARGARAGPAGRRRGARPRDRRPARPRALVHLRERALHVVGERGVA